MKNAFRMKSSRDDDTAYLGIQDTVPRPVQERLERRLTAARVFKVRLHLDMQNLVAWRTTRARAGKFFLSVPKGDWLLYCLFQQNGDGLLVRTSVEKFMTSLPRPETPA